ncbi:efflux RND transporter periplasmic adaptor subunit [Rhodoferax sp. UBA5149]|uniref:efflux RND transporter periplasmic adaptor subunit n=1 Tax=Rhodoferax sp. UBA5149 TaxID=1947379 RepID=UPI0025D27236|nr:efflux RND transporter periplasmic adaptor subunit [Rhodoferax sp. UBA5149]
MAKKIIYPMLAVMGIVGASGAAWWYQNKSHSAVSAVADRAANGPPSAAASAKPPAVDVAQVTVMRLTDDTQAVGSLRSRQGVMLRPEVSGRVTQLNFRDGDRVRKGQLLVQLDDQLPLAQVQQSKAELSIAVANHNRNKDLVAQNFISQRSVDESAANLEVAQAKLALSQATAARLKIVAPFDGIVGIRTVNVGDYLKDGADIVNIEDIDAVFVDFRLPERFQSKVRKGQTAAIQLDALPGLKFVAVIQAVDPLIDANGRSVGVRGCIDNRRLLLRPGMFARVTAVFGERDKAKVIPEEAIVPQGGQTYVIRLKPGTTAGTQVSQRVEVKFGIRRPGQVEILEGLDEGDTVVTAGQQRIQRDGTEVKVMDLPRPAVAPAASVSVPASLPSTVGAVAVGAKEVVAKTLQGPNPCLERRF